MPRPRTFPTLFDEVKTLDIKSYKEKGYLQPNQQNTGVTRWRRNGEETGSISFAIRMEETSGYLELDYNYKEEPIKYRVPIISKPSNLGKGLVWYFICPVTKKYCRKLYLISGYFLHREAFKGCMYESQTYSKRSRKLDRMCKQIFASENFWRENNRKYFKEFYAGKPTKRFLKLWRMQRKGLEQADQFEQLLKMR
ncbi:MAG: hypothetical protein SFU99_21685 [Saprospiraceae bacterium]|nr:hypothetical protein [Saprospiraceae bacterium]